MNANYYLKDILNASKNGRLTFFVGAGVSKLSKYPDWKELTNKFSKELGLEIRDEHSNYSNEEYLSIPQKYYYSIGKNDSEYYRLISEELDKPYIEPNLVHDLILMLKPSNIITTNFDNLIEKAVSRNGLFYDVIAKDSEVSKIKNTKFILKVHGDIKNRNIVLKEEDYLNYSNNFRLIETLLKSIFSMNVVVFIGYTLGDYNMKLILNWVRNLQGEDFRTPYFIYVDNVELSEVDMVYYESRGLKIIDYKKVVPKVDEWALRYETILKKIVNFKEKDVEISGSELLENLHRKLEPLKQLSSIRREDLNSKIGEDYRIDEYGVVYQYNPDADYLNMFNRISYKLSNSIELDEFESQALGIYKEIKEIFEKAFVFGFRQGRITHQYNFNYKINNT